MPRVRYPSSKPFSHPSPDAIKAARKKVLKAMVERAAEMERQSEVAIKALDVMRSLQMEVRAKDKQRIANYVGDGHSYHDFPSGFMPLDAARCTRVTFDSMLQNVDKIRLNARKLIAENVEKKKK
jgi:hypothetical protein